ncbi:hypothetical protein DH2020_007224 [Rehmannia glutinosa]|uniref:Protein kinase domain-containing protein n=1 Tax=Rehmannia glutinosa TaxID=99300 RepID=A0ABR0TYI1_REHGL
MASPSEKSSSSRSTIPLMPGRVVIAYDATRNPNAGEFKNIISNIRTRDRMIQEVDTITVLGVLHQVLHPMGFQMQIGPDSFIGTSVRAIKEEVSRMVDAYVGMLHQSAEECEHKGVVIEVKIVVGAPLKKAVVQEAVASNATWLIICYDRHLRKELRFYLKHIPCKVALVLDNFSLEVLRPYYSDKATDNIEHKLYYSLSKLVPILPVEYNANNEQSFVSPSYRGSMSSRESSDSEKSSFASSVTSKSKEQSFYSPDEFGLYLQMEKSDTNPKVESESDDSQPVMQNQRNLQMDSDAPFLSDEMKMDGLDSKGCSYSEIQIATDGFSSDNLLGEGLYGVVYKGQLKGGQLIIVKVQKEANTQGVSEFRSELADSGLAKWRTNKYDRQTKILGNLEYLAPEYAENGICSVKTDVFAFGIVLIQLISGRKAVDSIRDNQHQSLRQWAMPLIETLVLDELVDPRLRDSYSTYEVYQMARAAYLCIQNKPDMRPSIGERAELLRTIRKKVSDIQKCNAFLRKDNKKNPKITDTSLNLNGKIWEPTKLQGLFCNIIKLAHLVRRPTTKERRFLFLSNLLPEKPKKQFLASETPKMDSLGLSDIALQSSLLSIINGTASLPATTHFEYPRISLEIYPRYSSST